METQKQDKTKPKTKYRVMVMVEGSRLPTIEKEAAAAFKGDVISVRRADLEKSRADRLAAIQRDVEQAAQDIEELKDELDEWYDNLPEAFQNGDKGSELQEAVDALEELQNSLNDIDFDSISFPSMMG